MRGGGTGIDVELGELVRFFRLTAGKSANDVAAEARIPRTRLTSFELGKERLSVVCFCRVAKAVGKSPSELLAQAEARLDGEPGRSVPDTQSTMEFMASNRGRQLIRAWADCDDPQLLDAFANLFLAASLRKRTARPREAATLRAGS